jgi:hypothetical protein
MCAFGCVYVCMYVRVCAQRALILSLCCFAVDFIGMLSGASLFFQKVCTDVCMKSFMYVCMYVRMYACMYVCRQAGR